MQSNSGAQSRPKFSPHPGRIVIISSPSGGGKTTICRKLLSASRKRDGWRFSVSYTTRNRRMGERNGREYYFVSDAEFDHMTAGGLFAENFQVHEYKYGTPRKPLEEVRKTGGVMLLDVDVNGARKLKKEFPRAITIFILPPSKTALKRRLKLRGTESQAQLKVRLDNAIKEMTEFRRYGFDYVVINKEVNEAVASVLAIINSHHCRVENLSEEQLKKILS